MSNSNEVNLKEQYQNTKVKWPGYVALAFTIIFFGGVFSKSTGWTRVLDFSFMCGTWAESFTPAQGTGMRGAFMFLLTQAPAVALAMGVVNAVDGKQGLLAANKVLNPLFKPLFGFPGWCGLSAITGLFTSTDGGAILGLEAYEKGLVTPAEHSVFSCFQYVCSCAIGAPLVLASMWYPAVTAAGIPVFYTYLLVIVSKLLASNLMRLYIKVAKIDFSEEEGGLN